MDVKTFLEQTEGMNNIGRKAVYESLGHGDRADLLDSFAGEWLTVANQFKNMASVYEQTNFLAGSSQGVLQLMKAVAEAGISIAEWYAALSEREAALERRTGGTEKRQ